ncbi:uncharacterized, partial [Tachysurus ichikawai]
QLYFHTGKVTLPNHWSDRGYTAQATPSLLSEQASGSSFISSTMHLLQEPPGAGVHMEVLQPDPTHRPCPDWVQVSPYVNPPQTHCHWLQSLMTS